MSSARAPFGEDRKWCREHGLVPYLSSPRGDWCSSPGCEERAHLFRSRRELDRAAEAGRELSYAEAGLAGDAVVTFRRRRRRPRGPRRGGRR